MRILDLFAGFGWSEGLRPLGLHDIGLELNADACATRVAAGHATIRADVAQYPPERFRGFDGLIASPPCQDFSVAGKRAGRTGDKGRLIDLVPDWVEAIRPEWIACEQVPPCLGIWQEHAHRYRELGYSTWAGTLKAAAFGVPQTRRRSVLMASRRYNPGSPRSTHGLWVTQREAIGVTGRIGFPRRDDLGRSLDGYRTRDWRPADKPAFTLTEKARSWTVEDADGSQRPLDIKEALLLQGFRPDLPVQGSRSSQFLQVGNAVPPPMATAVIGQLTGRTVEVAA